jgi:predicted nucleotidyltransferase/predicted transcriptional regulator with HTH domain
MSKFLTNSEARRKLLGYFFTHVDENFYVREIAGFIKEDPGNISRDLRKLEIEGLFNSKTRGRTKYYSLNKEYPLFEEYKKIVFKTTGVGAALKNLVVGIADIEKAYLHGSFAKDNESKTSDIDLLIIGKVSDDFASRVRGLENDIGREINFSSYTREEFEKEKAKRGSFLYLVFKNKTIVIK